MTSINTLPPIRVIVAGTRSLTNLSLVYTTLDEFFIRYIQANQRQLITIISGNYSGADALGEHYAKQYNHPLETYPADWDQYGKSAGPKRNALMASLATHCICFWDGISRGSKNMIDNAIKYNLKLEVVYY